MLSNEVLLHILTQSKDATAVYDSADLHIRFVNQAMQMFWGKEGSIIGTTLEQAVPELRGQSFPDLLKRVWETGDTYRATDTPATLLVNGELKISYFDFEYRAIKDEDGKVIAILHTANDVSSRVINLQQIAEKKLWEKELITALRMNSEKLQEANDYLSAINRDLFDSNERISLLNERLLQSETDFKRLVAQAPVAIMVLMGDSLVIDLANQGMLDILDKDHAVVGLPILESMPELKGEPAVELIFEAFRSGRDFDGQEAPVRMKRNGETETRYFNFSYRPLRDGSRIIGVMDLAVEVTDQVLARRNLEAIIAEKTLLEQSLRANEQRLQGILDTMAEGVVICNTEGRLVYVNPMAQKIMGISEARFLKRKYNDTLWYNEQIDGAPLSREEHPMYKVLHTGLSIFDQEIGIVIPGREKIYISVNAAPLKDSSQQIDGCIVTFTEVTSRIKLIQQKDDFIGVASHELKTPVTTLKVSLQLLARMLPDDADSALSELVGQANRSMDKLSDLLNALLNSNRVSEGRFPLQKTSFLVVDLVEECCRHIQIAGNYTLTLNIDPKLELYADEQLIGQVIVNLVNNAVKYAPDADIIMIEAFEKDTSICVRVTDAGPGIAPEKLPYIFDRYYRADQSNGQVSGLGLGLYICTEIIQKHQGQIGVESELGKGSTFWFELPV